MKITESRLKSIIRNVISESNEFNSSYDHSFEDAAEKCRSRILELHQNATPEEIKTSIANEFHRSYPQFNELTELSPSEYNELITLSIISLVMSLGAGPLKSPY